MRCEYFISSCFLSAYSSPGAPQNVRLLADNRNIAVSWDPPTETDGNIRRYIVTWAILPNFQDLPAKVIVDGNVTAAFIAINNDVGRLFRIHVRGENKYGLGCYSVPRYIRIGNIPVSSWKKNKNKKNNNKQTNKQKNNSLWG